MDLKKAVHLSHKRQAMKEKNGIPAGEKGKMCGEVEALLCFRQLFDQYYRSLAGYAYRFVGDWGEAEDIVQDIFCALWEKREEIDFSRPLSPYLYRAVYNRSLNLIRSALIQYRVEAPGTLDEQIQREIINYNQHDELLLKEMETEIRAFIDMLPSQCRIIFRLSREEGLKNREIAERLRISEKAVEKQISKALKGLRAYLARTGLLLLLVGCFQG